MNKALGDIVIISAARTPFGAYLGDLKTLRTQDLAQIALEEAINRANIDKADIDEVICGNVLNSPSSCNVARVAALNAGLPYSSTAYTVNRVCGSGLQSIINASQALLTTDAKYIAAGGVESMSRAPYMLSEDVRYNGFRSGDKSIYDTNQLLHKGLMPDEYSHISHLGLTAEELAKDYNITRLTQDEFSYNSQMKAKDALDRGRFAKETAPVTTKEGVVVDTDSHLRPDTNIEKLSKLKPAFKEGGSVTAGNASGLNDGAAFLVLTRKENALEKGHKILAEVVDSTVVGLEPDRMGLGPAYAIRKILEDNKLTLSDISHIEINEAFAAQTIACLIELGITKDSDLYERVNPNGGAIALGHPLGASGARLATTICYEFMEKPDNKYAIASACIGGGMGIAILLKNGQ